MHLIHGFSSVKYPFYKISIQNRKMCLFTPLTESMRAYKLTQEDYQLNPAFLNRHEFQSLSREIWKMEPMASDRWLNELKPYKRAISQVVESTLLKYYPEELINCSEDVNVLEIGSGSHPLCELLPNALPKLKEQIHLSDVNEEAIEWLKTHYPKNRTQFLDILEEQPNPTYNCIVMTDVLNIFSKKELRTALANIYNLLIPGGYLIHFAIREAIWTHTLDEFKHDDLIYFPIFSAHDRWVGVYVSQKNEFMQFVHSLENADIKTTLLEYASLSPINHDDFCTNFCDQKQFHLFHKLGRLLEQLNCPVTDKIDFEEHFYERLNEALISFTIRESIERESTFTGPRSEIQTYFIESNRFSIDRIHREIVHIPNFTHAIQEDAKLHVLVAQKPKE